MTAFFLTATIANADKRIALVIGNGAYQNVARLDNPVNDAKLMADTLRGLGFVLVGGGAQTNLDKTGLDNAIAKFGSEVVGADVGLFYYAGHGVQVRNSNYLVPTNANPAREADVFIQMTDVAVVLSQMEGSGTKLNLLILDACRNNPFGGRGLRSADAGLAQIRAPEGTLISYATQPGNVAKDGTGANSPYTTALAQTIRRGGLDIFQTFNEVGILVKRTTGGDQQPWVSSSPIDGSFYFTAPPTASPPVRPPTDPLDEAERVWRTVKDSTSQAVLADFIRQFGGTAFGSMARARLEELKKAALAPVSQEAKQAPTQQAALAPAGGLGQATLLGKFGNWGAYAVYGTQKQCFALSSVLASGKSESRTAYLFVSTRPSEKVLNEVSFTSDYDIKPGSDGTLEIGGNSYAMYSQQRGFWIKNIAEEYRIIENMRTNSQIVINGTKTDRSPKRDVYSLNGFAEALDRANRECR